MSQESSASPLSAIIPRRSHYVNLVSDVVGRRLLRSAARHQLTVARVRRSNFDTRALATAGPTV